MNHSWHVTLYVAGRGLTTGLIPHAAGQFQLDVDFLDHALVARAIEGRSAAVALRPMSVADFYGQVMDTLDALGVPVVIHAAPNELPDAMPFAEDHEHASYDPEYAGRFWRILAESNRVFTAFRARFIGKCSPVHFFWGGADLAVTRFSGRRAPPHPGGVPHLPDWVSREAYSHEVASCGFWPGGGAVTYPAFYAYAYPEPAGFAEASVSPTDAFYSTELGEFLLPYDVVRTADDPDDVLLAFLQSTYEAAADHGGWDRRALERTVDPGTRLARVRTWATQVR